MHIADISFKDTNTQFKFMDNSKFTSKIYSCTGKILTLQNTI